MLSVYSFDQIALFARCVMVHRIGMLNMFLAPAVGALGGEYNPAGVSGPDKPTKRRRSPSRRGDKHREFYMSEAGDDASKERALLQSLAIVGVGVRTTGGE